jgi:hypothetical protein
MLVNLFQNLREFTIDSNGIRTANELIPSQSIVELREAESNCLVLTFQELLDFSDTADFAIKSPKTGVKVQQKNRTITRDPSKTYPCRNSCRGQSKPCKSPIAGQAANYTGFLELQAKQSGKMVDISDKTKDTGKNKPVKQGKTEMKATTETKKPQEQTGKTEKPIAGKTETSTTKTTKPTEARSQSSQPKPEKIQADIKAALGTDKTVTLDELQTQLGYRQSKYGNNPETNPLNKALKELRDSGDIEQTNEGQRGQPRFKLVNKEQSKPALTLNGNYKDPVAPIGKEDTGKIKLADVKTAQDKEDYARQELAAAKKSGDKKRIADWEAELKKAKIANVKTSQKAQKASQTSLFNPLAYDDELNKSGLLKGMFSENFTWTKEAIEFYKNYQG